MNPHPNGTRVVILHYAAPPIVGGVESTIDHHARLLAAAGYSVDVIAGRGDAFHPEVHFHRVPEIDSRHPEVLAVNAALTKGEIPAAFDALRKHLVQDLAKLLVGAQACIVHNAVTLHKNLALTAALRELSDSGIVRLLAWSHDFAWHDSLYTPDLHPGYPWDLLREAWPGVRYIVVSEHRRTRLAELFRLPENEITVITPGVDIFEFLKLEPLTERLVKELNLLASDPLMLLPARITRRKNIELAVRITAELRTHFPAVKLIVTGPPGPHNPKNAAYLDELQTLTRDLYLEGYAHFLYQLGRGDEPLLIPDVVIADLFRLADGLIFPSRREGFGIPVLEAGLARLPVFAADIPPVLESAGPYAERFNPKGDPRRIAHQIAGALKKDRAFALRRRVMENFTWQAILKNQLIPLIERKGMVDEPSQTPVGTI